MAHPTVGLMLSMWFSATAGTVAESSAAGILWATWLGAGATILAAVVPGVLWFSERKDRKKAQADADAARDRELAGMERRSAQEAEDRRLDQARRVALVQEPTGRIIALNRSEMPIYGVMLVTIRSSRDSPEFRTPRATPIAQREALAPGDSWPTDQAEWVSPLWLRFMDAAGEMWLRDIRGELITVRKMNERGWGPDTQMAAELLLTPEGSPAYRHPSPAERYPEP